MPSNEPSKTCAIVVPVYNEESVLPETLGRLKKLIEGIRDYQFEIICVNDGSEDRTPEILESLKYVTVITHPMNRGYGAALKTALNYCTQDWICIVDADGTYPIEQMGALLKEAEGGMHMVVGSRQGGGISKSPHKRVARWVLRKMVHVLTGVMVPDLNSGMRVFRRELYLEFRHLLPMGFSFTTTLTVASIYSGYRTRYVPIPYAVRVGKSKIRPFRDFFRFTILIIRLATYFEPLSFFLPFAAATFILGFLRGIRDIVVTNHLGNFAIVLTVFAFQIFITGIMADVVVRRAAHGGAPMPASSNRIRKGIL